MADLFKEIIPSILQTKKDVFEDDPTYKTYLPFLVNKALSFHLDCILYANEINMHSELDNKLQNAYLINTIRPIKRKFQPWQKAQVNTDIECVKAYFGYSNEKAKEALRILSDEQLAIIKAKTEKGGVNK